MCTPSTPVSMVGDTFDEGGREERKKVGSLFLNGYPTVTHHDNG